MTKYHSDGFVGFKSLRGGMKVVVDIHGRFVSGKLIGKPTIRTYDKSWTYGWEFEPKGTHERISITSADVVEIIKKK